MSKVEADGGGLRFDQFKVRVDLMPALWEWALSVVLTRGAYKYDDNNWMRGMKWSKVAGPLKRHFIKWMAGEIYDPDTGCHHLAMVAWNALALMYFQIMGLGTNNLGVHGEVGLHQERCMIDAFDWVNNKPVEVYIKEVAELKADINGTTVDEELKLILERA